MTLNALLAGTLAALVAGTTIGQILRVTAHSEQARQTVANINARIGSWWLLCGLTALALVLHNAAVFTLFAVFSVLALREFLAITPEGRAQLVPLIVLTLVHYGVLWMAWPMAASTVIPVGALLCLAAWNLLAGPTSGYLQRSAEAWWAFMVATYCLSYAPAMLTLDIAGYAGRNATLLFYFLLVVQSSDVLQYVFGKLLGRHTIAPAISPHKTWEGSIGGIGAACVLGTLLCRSTPFPPAQAAATCAAATLAGFTGGLVMSAIKRDRGIKDYGTFIPGHGGVLDRIDSLCFSAPVFYHCVRLLYVP